MPNGLSEEIRHPELKRLYGYWMEKKGTRLAPARSDIHPGEMRSSHLFMLEVLGQPPRFRFRLAGSEIVNRFGEEITGRFLDGIDLDEVGGEILREYENAASQAQPIYGLWNYTRHGGHHMRYERLILPLSSDGERVDMLLCGAHVDGWCPATASGRQSGPRSATPSMS